MKGNRGRPANSHAKAVAETKFYNAIERLQAEEEEEIFEEDEETKEIQIGDNWGDIACEEDCE